MSTEPIALAIERLHRLGVTAELAAPPVSADPSQELGHDVSAIRSIAAPPINANLSSLSAADAVANEAPGVWTIEAVRCLGTTTDVPTAAQILGIGRTLAFHLVRTDAFPVRFLRFGTRIVVPVPELLRLLGATP